MSCTSSGCTRLGGIELRADVLAHQRAIGRPQEIGDLFALERRRIDAEQVSRGGVREQDRVRVNQRDVGQRLRERVEQPRLRVRRRRLRRRSDRDLLLAAVEQPVHARRDVDERAQPAVHREPRIFRPRAACADRRAGVRFRGRRAAASRPRRARAAAPRTARPRSRRRDRRGRPLIATTERRRTRRQRLDALERASDPERRDDSARSLLARECEALFSSSAPCGTDSCCYYTPSNRRLPRAGRPCPAGGANSCFAVDLRYPNALGRSRRIDHNSSGTAL